MANRKNSPNKKGWPSKNRATSWKPRNFGSASGQQLPKYTPVTWAIQHLEIHEWILHHFPFRDISVHWASAAWPPVMFVDRNLPNQFLELCRNQLSYQESVMSWICYKSAIKIHKTPISFLEWTSDGSLVKFPLQLRTKLPMESHITPGRVRNPSSIAWMSWGSHVAMKSWDEHHLVGGAITILKNMSSSVGMILPNIWK